MRLELLRIGLGVSDLVATRNMARAELGRAPDPVSMAALRVLGARQVLHGAMRLRFRSAGARHLAALVDGLHALSMAGLAVVDRRRRRGAMVQMVVATGFGIGEWASEGAR